MNTTLNRLAKSIPALLGLACALALPVRAAPILSLTPVSQAPIYVGGQASLNLTIMGLDGTLLAGWSSDIVFDYSILSAPTVAYGPLLAPSNQFSADYGLWFHAEDVATGAVGAQPTMFTLATFTFTGLAAGTSTVRFDRDGDAVFSSLTDEQGNSLEFVIAEDATIVVQNRPQGVPDSSPMLPFSAALGMMLLLGRRLRRQT
jgi:hypothetical protein